MKDHIAKMFEITMVSVKTFWKIRKIFIYKIIIIMYRYRADICKSKYDYGVKDQKDNDDFIG